MIETRQNISRYKKMKFENDSKSSEYKGLFHADHLPGTVGMLGFVVMFALFTLQTSLSFLGSSGFVTESQPTSQVLGVHDEKVEDGFWGKLKKLFLFENDDPEKLEQFPLYLDSGSGVQLVADVQDRGQWTDGNPGENDSFMVGFHIKLDDPDREVVIKNFNFHITYAYDDLEYLSLYWDSDQYSNFGYDVTHEVAPEEYPDELASQTAFINITSNESSPELTLKDNDLLFVLQMRRNDGTASRIDWTDEDSSMEFGDGEKLTLSSGDIFFPEVGSTDNSNSFDSFIRYFVNKDLRADFDEDGDVDIYDYERYRKENRNPNI